MHNLLQRHRKLLSVVFSVACSVFLVVVVVSAATTIGANISTGGTLAVTSSSTISSTLAVIGAVSSSHIYPWTNNTRDLGAYSTAWKDVYASGTVRADYVSVQNYVDIGGSGSSASTSLRSGASATSTFSSGVIINEDSATSTLYLGHFTSSTPAGQGGCIALGSTSSTHSNGGFLFLFVKPNLEGNRLELATSSNPLDCSR